MLRPKPEISNEPASPTPLAVRLDPTNEAKIERSDTKRDAKHTKAEANAFKRLPRP